MLPPIHDATGVVCGNLADFSLLSLSRGLARPDIVRLVFTACHRGILIHTQWRALISRRSWPDGRSAYRGYDNAGYE